MKLLSKEDLKGIDSTKETIAKWDEFFRMAIPNLGYKQRVVDEMYPYSKGIPKMDGTYLPVSHTGRVFFEMSWADKLAMTLSCLNSSSTMSSTNNTLHRALKYVMCYVWGRDLDFLKKCVPDLTEEQIGQYAHSIATRDAVLAEAWKKFIDDSCIMVWRYGDNKASDEGRHKINNQNHVYSEEEKEILKNESDKCITDALELSNSNIIWYASTLKDIYGNGFPENAFSEAIYNMSSNNAAKFEKFKEVYMQQYLVVSLNPIDKFMCSTKQAFSSCISIAKQSDTRGTQSTHAFGLPALFPSDSIFMVFMTNGKHKNMYWEQEEWEKPGEERSKAKAYKYLKMTCRALTYKGTLLRSTIPTMKDLAEDTGISEELRDAYKGMNPEQERLFIGRHYSANGEDFMWTIIAEILLALQGISTGMAYLPSFSTIGKAIWEKRKAGQWSSITKFERFNKSTANPYATYLRLGSFVGDKGVEIDKYGYVRGIYYDNIIWSLNISMQAYRGAHSSCVGIPERITTTPLQPDGDHQIYADYNRHGSGGVSMCNPNSGLDMFKMMRGLQKYNYLNRSIKICHECGEILSPEEAKGHAVNHKNYCNSCREKLNIQECPCCHALYPERDAAEHEVYNIRELTHPQDPSAVPPKMVCKSQLKQASAESRRPDRNIAYICAHCGELSTEYYYSHSSDYLTVAEFHGINITVSLCGQCRTHAVMCDRCKRVVFVGQVSDACILLNNRRVICPECIDKIRAKQEVRNKLKEVLANLTWEDIQEEVDEDVPLQDIVARRMLAGGLPVGNPKTLIKDIARQIDSYMKAHGGQLPVLRASSTPEERQEEELVIL